MTTKTKEPTGGKGSSGGETGVKKGRKPPKKAAKVAKGGKKVTLKDVAELVGLSPATVSVVLNRSPVADSIPRETQERVIEGARKLNYRPNYMARSLRSQRSFTVGVLLAEILGGYAGGILSGIERRLMQEGYFYLVGSHRTKDDLLSEYIELLKDRQVEGFILVATPLERPPGLPTVAIAGHKPLEGVSNVVLDHDRAAVLALEHLVALGHRRIALFKGHPDSADTEERWRANLETVDRFGIESPQDLRIQLSDPEGKVFTPEDAYLEGYSVGRELLDRGVDFTALFAFNDVSAIGAMRAFLDAGLRIPEDVSVVGFDDIQSAAFQNPGLTTVRQPLFEMGELATKILLERLSKGGTGPEVLNVEPQLIVRGSTGPAPKLSRTRKARAKGIG